MMVYYIEGDRGHLMTERSMRPQHRYAARGNAFSFHMPWKDIMAALAHLHQEDTKSMLPHPPSVVARLVRLHIFGGKVDLSQYLKEVKLRSHVVLKLMLALVERHHPVFASQGDVTKIRLRLTNAMQERYPDTEAALPEEQRQGTIPPAVLAEIVAAFRPHIPKESVIHEKNATPAEESKPISEALEGIRPHAVMEERYSEIGQDVNASRAHALANYCKLTARTGTDFVSQ